MALSIPCTLSCDLCGCQEFTTLLTARRSMTSDSRLTELPLEKISCNHCGLGMNRNNDRVEDLTRYYAEEYTLNNKGTAHEHQFVIDGQAISRSRFIFEWMETLIQKTGRHLKNLSLMEVGCGSGELLAHFPNSIKKGIELNKASAELALQKGLQVKNGTYQDIEGQFDLIISFGVIEHVPSPTDFLKTLRKFLNPEGLLLIGQPIQDNQSYDIFFIDHLHHFFLPHLSAYFAKTGFHELAQHVGHGPMTNFSLHLLQAASPQEKSVESQPSHWNLSGFYEEFQALDQFLAEQVGKNIYAYGASECLKLYEANTGLQSYIKGVLDDFQPTALKLGDLEKDQSEEVCFILTMNTAYQEKVSHQIKERFPTSLIYSVQRKSVL